MTRTDELLSIGLLRIEDITKKLFLSKDTVRRRIVKLEIIPFEQWWYDEYQIELIKDCRL